MLYYRSISLLCALWWSTVIACVSKASVSSFCEWGEVLVARVTIVLPDGDSGSSLEQGLLHAKVLDQPLPAVTPECGDLRMWRCQAAGCELRLIGDGKSSGHRNNPRCWIDGGHS